MAMMAGVVVSLAAAAMGPAGAQEAADKAARECAVDGAEEGQAWRYTRGEHSTDVGTVDPAGE